MRRASHLLPDRVLLPAKTESRKLCGLDLVRFVAALLIVFHHLGLMRTTGWVGVEIFFVLSGFVIAYTAQQATPSSFATSRLVRLYPAAWICSTITVAILLLSAAPGSKRTLLLVGWCHAVTLWPFGPMLSPVYWTLRVEMLFYLVVFLTLLTGTLRHMPRIISAAGLLSTSGWLYAALPARQLSSWPARQIAGFYSTSLFRNAFLLPFSPFFAIGVLLWLCLLERTTVERVGVLLLCSIGAMLEIRSHTLWFGPNLSCAVPLALWLAAVGTIVVSVKGNHRLVVTLGPHGIAFTRALGLMSYPLYLVHLELGSSLIRIMRVALSDVISLPLTVFSVLLISFGLYRFLEAPLQYRLRKLLTPFSATRNTTPPLVSSLP